MVGYGNVLTAISFLLGLAAEDRTGDECAVQDASYPLVACARVERIVT